MVSSNQRSRKDNTKINREQANSRIRLDELDIKIIKALFNEPNITSTNIAQKHNQALSTIQRRRVKLERELIKRNYAIDIAKLGWRLADLSISVEKGMAKKTAQELVTTKRNNVITATLRIGDPIVDVIANVFYKDSHELHDLIESVKGMPNVTHVEWSEIVETTESNASYMIDRILAPAA